MTGCFFTTQREGTRAYTAVRFLKELVIKKGAGTALEGGDADFFADRGEDELTRFDWVDDSFFGLAR